MRWWRRKYTQIKYWAEVVFAEEKEDERHSEV